MRTPQGAPPCEPPQGRSLVDPGGPSPQPWQKTKGRRGSSWGQDRRCQPAQRDKAPLCLGLRSCSTLPGLGVVGSSDPRVGGGLCGPWLGTGGLRERAVAGVGGRRGTGEQGGRRPGVRWERKGIEVLRPQVSSHLTRTPPWEANEEGWCFHFIDEKTEVQRGAASPQAAQRGGGSGVRGYPWEWGWLGCEEFIRGRVHSEQGGPLRSRAAPPCPSPACSVHFHRRPHPHPLGRPLGAQAKPAGLQGRRLGWEPTAPLSSASP